MFKNTLRTVIAAGAMGVALLGFTGQAGAAMQPNGGIGSGGGVGCYVCVGPTLTVYPNGVNATVEGTHFSASGWVYVYNYRSSDNAYLGGEWATTDSTGHFWVAASTPCGTSYYFRVWDAKTNVFSNFTTSRFMGCIG